MTSRPRRLRHLPPPPMIGGEDGGGIVRVPCDGSPASADALVTALRAALTGGPPVAPHRIDRPGCPAGPTGPAALVVATSGSSGGARHVLLSAAALTASATATHERLGGPGHWLLALPGEHVAGVQVVVRALLAGTRPVTLDLRRGFTPDGFAAAAGAIPGPRRYTSLVPTQLRRLLDAGGSAVGALRSFDRVLVGGAALDPALATAAAAAGVAVTATYGMSETAGGCVYDGRPLAGVGVRLGPDGRVALAGPTLADGYLNRPADTAAAFVDGWFCTGDLGRLAPDGRLEILGRADDVIVTGGEKVAPAAVERVLATQDGIAAACVVGVPDAEWGQLVAAAYVVGRGPGGTVPEPEGLRAAVREALGRAAVPRRLVRLAELPLRGVGKPDRAAVTALLAGDHPPG